MDGKKTIRVRWTGQLMTGISIISDKKYFSRHLYWEYDF